MFSKAFCLVAIVAVSSVAFIEASPVKGRQDFESSNLSNRFAAPGQVKSPSANRRLSLARAPSKINLPPIQQQLPIPQQQEQQQESEIDPTGAANQADPASLARPAENEAEPAPEPYSFNYNFEAGDSATAGSSERQETQDASGKVTGFYTLKGEDGRDRRVEYTADANGFRAVVVTNEMGTAPKNTADVEWQAQAPSDGQLRAAESATELARQRALAQPRGKAQGNRHPIDQQREAFASASKTNPQIAQQQYQQQQEQQQQQQFEQIRQTNEFNARTRRSRRASPHFPEFYY